MNRAIYEDDDDDDNNTQQLEEKREVEKEREKFTDLIYFNVFVGVVTLNERERERERKKNPYVLCSFFLLKFCMHNDERRKR